MLTRRRPGVYGRGKWFWLYVRAVFVSLILVSFLALVGWAQRRGERGCEHARGRCRSPPRRSLSSAFRPRPGRYAPPRSELVNRHRKDRAGLRNLLAVYFECHG